MQQRLKNTKLPGFFHDDRFEISNKTPKNFVPQKIEFACELQELPLAIRNKKIASRITIVQDNDNLSKALRNFQKIQTKNKPTLNENNAQNFRKKVNINQKKNEKTFRGDLQTSKTAQNNSNKVILIQNKLKNSFEKLILINSVFRMLKNFFHQINDNIIIIILEESKKHVFQTRVNI